MFNFTSRWLVLALLVAACEPQVVRLAADEDGSHAYAKVAEAWCGQLERCAKAARAGRPFASHEACVQRLTRGMSANGREITCDGSNDIAIEPQSLARCLQAFENASCQRLPDFGGEGIALLSLDALLAGCRDAIDQMYAIEAELHALPPVGSACDDRTPCRCEVEVGAACGICTALPQAGEPCLREGDSRSCGGPYTCSQHETCEREAGAEGERCVDGRCQHGLECTNERCLQLHREGDRCTASGCGPWFVCEEGECRYRPGQGLGEPCSFDSALDSERCWLGLCIDGVCTEPPEVGEACARECPSCDPECLSPFKCIDGICKEFAFCAAGIEEPCVWNSDCLPGYHCNDSDFRCRPTETSIGERCVPEGGCASGVCEGGWCVWQSVGEPCGEDDDCASRRCDEERCAASAC